MSRFGKGRKLPGSEFTWDADPNGEPDGAPTPLYPKYTVPRARPLSARETHQVNLYRDLRERFHDGPYYSVLDAASSAAKKNSAARASFDPFHGMPSYSGRYQKKKRALPRMSGRAYVMKFFPRELWPTIQPNFKGDAAAAMDGYVPQTARSGVKRGFEDDDEEEDDDAAKKQKNGEDGEGPENDDLLEGEDEEQEEEIIDDDFEDDEDEMGGDYNAEQYFDGGDDEYGDDGFGDGGGGGEEDTY
ncbi:III, C31 subunit of DNA-directed RNA polymerase [Aspergillus steynii IBT 23096]|uniref:DNA-directed RNA polymerase III subunit n=1 Tax=Aspergillus steynii IBT 23096 TaxID=1392250 RepID=A0A2I2FRD9_9EURO|nr:III, C31 subunit of DNA-directed RNA polymerase [Aspergillus steynii IBT 23096]PLB43200.1 III, C31 subunit of DNA-directed RNA polymerase [Aspergillus steynii IBT 23096]